MWSATTGEINGQRFEKKPSLTRANGLPGDRNPKTRSDMNSVIRLSDESAGRTENPSLLLTDRPRSARDTADRRRVHSPKMLWSERARGGERIARTEARSGGAHESPFTRRLRSAAAATTFSCGGAVLARGLDGTSAYGTRTRWRRRRCPTCSGRSWQTAATTGSDSRLPTAVLCTYVCI